MLTSGAMLVMRGYMAVAKFFQFIRVIRQIIRLKKGWAAVQGVLNVVMSANPIGIIITAIGALIGAVAMLIKHWDKIKTHLQPIISWAKTAWDNFTSWISTAVQTIGDAIRTGFDAALSFVKRIFMTFADYILSTLGNIVKAVLNVSSAVGGALGFDTSGIDRVTKKLSNLQEQVRSQSAIGDMIGQAGTQATLIGGNDAQNSRTETVNRSEVDINIAGAPPGSTTRQRGRAPNVRLNLGEAGGAF
jgi:phage-related protein